MTLPVDPHVSIIKMLRYWWVVFIFAVGGATLGWLLSSFLPPKYEAYAAISVSIDFTRTGQLTDIEEDLAFVAVGDIVKSSKVMNSAEEKSNLLGLLEKGESISDYVFLERENERWLLIVRSGNAQRSADIANVWAKEADLAIQEAYHHALIAEHLARYMDGLSGCLQQMALDEGVQALCHISNLSELQNEIDATARQLQQEKTAALGLMPASHAYLQQWAEPPSQPVIYGRANLIFAGGVMGFLAGIWIVETDRIRNLTNIFKKNHLQ